MLPIVVAGASGVVVGLALTHPGRQVLNQAGYFIWEKAKYAAKLFEEAGNAASQSSSVRGYTGSET